MFRSIVSFPASQETRYEFYRGIVSECLEGNFDPPDLFRIQRLRLSRGRSFGAALISRDGSYCVLGCFVNYAFEINDAARWAEEVISGVLD